MFYSDVIKVHLGHYTQLLSSHIKHLPLHNLKYKIYLLKSSLISTLMTLLMKNICDKSKLKRHKESIVALTGHHISRHILHIVWSFVEKCSYKATENSLALFELKTSAGKEFHSTGVL